MPRETGTVVKTAIGTETQMFMNLLAFLVLSFIVGCGIWLADNISDRDKDLNCGRISPTNCVPMPGPSGTR
jgi:hypothetical protein